MNPDELSRRDFFRNTSVLAAGTVADSLATDAQPSDQPASTVDPSKILNYNPQMGYRRLGTTWLMISEVSLGGHWRVPWREPQGNCWGTFIDDPAPVVPDRIAQNRTEVVSACIDAGMNYLDHTGLAECMAFGAALASFTRQLGQSATAADWLRLVTEEQWADLLQEYAWLRDGEFV